MAKSNATISTAARTYDHKTFGRLGAVTLEVSADESNGRSTSFILNGTILPASSVDHLLTFALQSLQDAYAGAESAEDAQARFDAKLKRILEGTLGSRSGSAADPVQVEIRALIRSDVKNAIGAEAWKAMEEEARNAAIDQVFADQPDEVKAALTDAAKGEIERKAAEKAAKAKLAAKLTINLAK